jgi:DnaD/phage-associated family protein
MIVTSPSDNGVTLIDNSFIDHYMADANGEFVKIYLYLVRCACPGRDVSIPGIADFFEQTEGDVRRALNYWKSQGLVDLVQDASGQISQIVLRSCSCAPAGAAFQTKGASVRVTAASVPSQTGLPQSASRSQAEADLPPSDLQQKIPVSGAFGPDPAAMTASGSDEQTAAKASGTFPAEEAHQQKQNRQLRRTELGRLYYVAEIYFQRNLSSSEISMLEYFVNDLNMSVDLVEYLLEYCIGKGHISVRYMETVAQNWVAKNITTVQQAKDESRSFGGDYTVILRELGLTRNPAPAETALMDKWLSEYAFSLDLIKEACRRTVLQASSPSLSYTDSILTRWHNASVRSLQDVAKLDADHEASKSDQKNAEKPKSGQKRTGQSKSRLQAGGHFSSYSHEDLDWNAIGLQIMKNQKQES